MIYNILANIDFDFNSKRKSNIKNGYRPGFKFSDKNSMFSGIIYLVDYEELMPGKSSDAVIGFFSDEPFKEININSKFKFYEGPNLIGHGIIKELLGWDVGNVPR